MNQKNKISILLLAILLLFGSLLPMASVYANDKVVTLEEEMKEAVDRGIMYGYGDAGYKPNENVTRAQFAALIKRALKLPEAQGNFQDITSNMTLAPAVNAVAAAGIMQGVSANQFNPEALITREQVALTIVNALQYSGMALVPRETDFLDAGDMTSTTKLAIFHASNYEIINGMPENGKLRFAPKAFAKRSHAAAFIIRFLNAKESYVPPVVEKPETPTEPVTPPPVVNPKPPTEPVTPPPVVEPKPPTEPVTPPADPTKYYNAVIEDGALVKGKSEYTTYTAALSAFSNNAAAKGIYKGKELMQIKNGLAYAKNNTTGGTTVIYSDSSFAKQVSYIQYGRELVLLESNDKYVKVQAGGTIGFAKQSEIEYIPTELITNKDYYIPSSTGVLLHYTYDHAKNSFGNGPYEIGPAPTFMTNLQKYYSQDGVNFTNANGKVVGKHYPYFQYLSARSKTNYSAQELDAYIMDRLQKVSVSKHPTALTKSKLIGLGKFLKEVENKYNVNALFILSAAMHEGDSGMSWNAQTKNNLFGIKVYDTSPEAGEQFKIPEDSIIRFVTHYVNLNYGPPTGPYAKGLAPGNKSTGMNVHYASDPNWGAKIAQYMWRGDALLGYKDTGANKKQLALTTYSGTINVRSTPEVKSDNLLYTYRAKELGINNDFGYPLVIVDEKIGTDGYKWFKVLSDQAPPTEFGWVREKDGNATLVKKIN